MTDPMRQALELWGLQGAECNFVAGRENKVYHVRTATTAYALRLKRPGYRDESELLSELAWLKAMDRAGLHVPAPVPSLAGRLLEPLGDGFADLVGWLPGQPLGQSRVPLVLADRAGTFRALGAEIARLHAACDAWTPPAGFTRCAWDRGGLLGERPVWGRFWQNPTLDPATASLLSDFRRVAQDRLAAADPDYGLIHADLLRENILLDGSTIRPIDFDDGGFGFRVFDLATLLLKTMSEPDYPALRSALLQGYLSERELDLSLLDLFIALRAATYVGWIIPRMSEPGGAERNLLFVDEACAICSAYLEGHDPQGGVGRPGGP